MRSHIIAAENPIFYKVASFTRNVSFQLFERFDIMIDIHGDAIRNSVLIYIIPLGRLYAAGKSPSVLNNLLYTPLS